MSGTLFFIFTSCEVLIDCAYFSFTIGALEIFLSTILATPLFYCSEITHFLLQSSVANLLFFLCKDIFGYRSYICYRSLHYFIIVFLYTETSIVYSNRRSFWFVIALYYVLRTLWKLSLLGIPLTTTVIRWSFCLPHKVCLPCMFPSRLEEWFSVHKERLFMLPRLQIKIFRRYHIRSAHMGN